MLNISQSNTRSPWATIIKAYYKAEDHISLFGMVMFIMHVSLLICFFRGISVEVVGVLNRNVEVIASLISFILWGVKLWTKQSINVKALVWLIGITYLGPFWFVLGFLQNEGMVIWEFVLIAGFSGLVFLIHSGILIPVIFVGLFAGLFVFQLTSQDLRISSNIVEISIILFVSLVYFTYLEIRRERLAREKIDFLRGIGGFIAHELRTPVLSMLIGARRLRDSMETIDLKVNGTFEEARYLERLKECPKTIEKSGEEALMSIEMFLLKLKGSQKVYESSCDAASLIKEAIQTYPLGDHEGELIDLIVNDTFLFKGNKVVVKHIIYNLLKNALYSIHACGKGTILISLDHSSRFNIIRVKDFASGIPSNKMHEIFKQFSSIKPSGTGLGLPFCKLSMEDMGGVLECESKEGEYTEFILKFPKQEQ